MESELQSSGTAGISYLNTEGWNGVAINPIDDVTSEGNLVWGDQLILYLWSASNRSLVKLWREAGGSRHLPTTLSTSEMLEAAAGIGPHNVPIGEDVTEFSVVNRGIHNSGKLIELVVELERELPSQATRTFRLTKSVVLVN